MGADLSRSRTVTLHQLFHAIEPLVFWGVIRTRVGLRRVREKVVSTCNPAALHTLVLLACGSLLLDQRVPFPLVLIALHDVVFVFGRFGPLLNPNSILGVVVAEVGVLEVHLKFANRVSLIQF